MASVQSPLRTYLKPLLFKVFGETGYRWFQYYGKVRDIEQRLVEEAEMALLPKILSRSSVSLDIGANYAYYTVRLAELSPKGTVYAFEPIPFTFQVCRKIVERFQLSNVELFQLGVGEREQTLAFEVPVQEAGAISAGQAHMSGRNNTKAGKEIYHPFERHRSFDCKVISIDNFLPDLKRLDFVKIDIEGAELFALKGMTKALERHKPAILIEVCPFFLDGFGIKESELWGLFNQSGYECFSFSASSQRLKSCHAPLSDGNYILLHRTRLNDYREILPSES